MADDLHVLSVILVVAVTTVVLRALPFVAVEALSSNRFLKYLGRQMPVGVMILLVAYTFKDVQITQPPYGLPQLFAMLVAVGLYWRLNNTLVSIGAGLTFYLYAVNWL